MSEEVDIERRFRRVGDCLLCTKCGKPFNTVTNVLTHFNNCRVYPHSVTVVVRACRMVQSLIKSNEIVAVKRAEENPYLSKVVVTEGTANGNLFQPYWGIRPAKGQTLERTS